MKRWPDGTPKSQGNAFDWKANANGITFDPRYNRKVLKTDAEANKTKTFTVYSKAKGVKLAYAGND